MLPKDGLELAGVGTCDASIEMQATFEPSRCSRNAFKLENSSNDIAVIFIDKALLMLPAMPVNIEEFTPNSKKP